MLRLFRSNQIFTSVLLIFYIGALQASVFWAPFKWAPVGQGLFSEWLYGWVGSQTPVAHIVAMFLLLVQGFMVNALAINHRLSNEVNLFPGVFFVLLSCAIPDFLYLSPELLGDTFFLLALLQLMEVYKVPACADSIFNAGLCVSLASFFYFPFLFFFVVLVAGLNILRAFKLREQLIMFSGILVPYFLLGVYYFWFDRFDYFWEIQIGRNADFLSFGITLAAGIYWKLAAFALLLLTLLFNNSSYFQKKDIKAQKKISILNWVLAGVAISALFQSTVTLEHLMLLAIPGGIFLAITFTAMKPQVAEALHFILFVSVLAMQFSIWLL
ncbi:MAG: hypothetical protein EPO28_00985 [Saprospiraceae bacterium]|nr:MAG: hypothetical protein EPO28_00985 [Saprospiraceae bacterium]